MTSQLAVPRTAACSSRKRSVGTLLSGAKATICPLGQKDAVGAVGMGSKKVSASMVASMSS